MQRTLLTYIFGESTEYCERIEPNNIYHYSGRTEICHLYREPFVNGKIIRLDLDSPYEVGSSYGELIIFL